MIFHHNNNNNNAHNNNILRNLYNVELLKLGNLINKPVSNSSQSFIYLQITVSAIKELFKKCVVAVSLFYLYSFITIIWVEIHLPDAWFAALSKWIFKLIIWIKQILELINI